MYSVTSHDIDELRETSRPMAAQYYLGSDVTQPDCASDEERPEKKNGVTIICRMLYSRLNIVVVSVFFTFSCLF